MTSLSLDIFLIVSRTEGSSFSIFVFADYDCTSRKKRSCRFNTKDQRSIAHDDLVRRYRLTRTHFPQRSQQIYTDNKDRAIGQCLKNDLTWSVLLSICRVAAAVGTRSCCPANHHATRLAKLISMVQNVTRDGVSNESNASPPALHLHRRRSPQRIPNWIEDVEPRSHGLETRSAPHSWMSQPDAGTPEVGRHTTPYRCRRQKSLTHPEIAFSVPERLIQATT
jgi:hypothetical protein